MIDTNQAKLISIILVFLSLNLFAQKDQMKIKFGDIKPEVFSPIAYSIDSSAGTVYLKDIGITIFTVTASSYFFAFTVKKEAEQIVFKKIH